MTEHSHKPVVAEPVAPVRTTTIAGNDYAIVERFAPGHVLSENEAEALNSLFIENVGNNCRAQIERLTEAAKKEGKVLTQAELQAIVTDYAKSYVFGQRRSRVRAPADPLQAAGIKVAKEWISKRLAELNKTYTKEQLHEAAAKLYEQNPAVKAEAQRRLDTAAKIGGAALGELG